MDPSAVGPPAVLLVCIAASVAISVFDVCRNAVPEKSRIPVGRRFMLWSIFCPPLLYGASGYLLWMTGYGLPGIYIAYFGTLGLACLLRAAVPQIERLYGDVAGRWTCLTSFLLTYGTLFLSLHWAIAGHAVSIAPHCGAILTLSVYDLPFYLLRPPRFTEVQPLLTPDGIRPV